MSRSKQPIPSQSEMPSGDASHRSHLEPASDESRASRSRMTAVKAAAAAVALGLVANGSYDIYERFTKETGPKIKAEETEVSVLIERAVAKASFGVGILESSVDGRANLAIDIAGLEVPGSGFEFKLEDGNGGSSDKNTDARVRTYVSINAEDVQIERGPTAYQVMVNPANIDYHSSFVAGEHTVVSDSNTFASYGESIGKGLSALKKTFGFDEGVGMDAYTERIRAVGTSFTHDLALAKVDQECAPQATSIVQPLFEKSFRHFAALEGVKPEAVQVVWTGPVVANIQKNYGLDSLYERDNGTVAIRVEGEPQIETECMISAEANALLLDDESRLAKRIG